MSEQILRIPKPEYDKDVNKVLDLYHRAMKNIAQRILIDMANQQSSSYALQIQSSLLRQIDTIVRELEEKVGKEVTYSIRKLFDEGQARHLVGLGMFETITDATKGVAFSQLAKSRVEVLLQDTFDDLLMSTQNMAKSTKKLIRNVVSDIIKMESLQSTGRKTVSKQIANKLTAKGLSKRVDDEAFVGVVDKAGRRWNVKTYVEMVTRTKYRQSVIEGQKVQGIESGMDLALISAHGADDACGKWEGVVVSMNGLIDGFPTLDEVQGTGEIFHPNCQHHVNSIRKFELLPKSYQEKHLLQIRKKRL